MGKGFKATRLQSFVVCFFGEGKGGVDVFSPKIGCLSCLSYDFAVTWTLRFFWGGTWRARKHALLALFIAELSQRAPESTQNQRVEVLWARQKFHASLVTPFTLAKLTASTSKWMVGILVSFWGPADFHELCFF